MNKTVSVVAVLGICLASCARPASASRPPSHTSPRPTPVPTFHVVVPAGTASALGVFEAKSPSGYGQTDEFNQAIGRKANLALYFSGWGEGFQLAFANTARENGAIPTIQIDPATVSLAAIAAGRYDAYLRSYAQSVRDYGTPVVIGFAHEPNGFWYSWGYTHVSAAIWIQAWRHVVNVFRGASARNVIWLWTVNVSATSPYPLHAWWPGPSYVNWIGVDGYYANPSDTFDSLFDSSITQIRSFTHDPILLAETAVGPGTGNMTHDVMDLLQGIRRDNLLGLVWYDAGGPRTRQDWRLEDHPAELAAFRAAVQEFIRS